MGFLIELKAKSDLRGVSPEPIGICDTLGTFGELAPNTVPIIPVKRIAPNRNM